MNKETKTSTTTTAAPTANSCPSSPVSKEMRRGTDTIPTPKSEHTNSKRRVLLLEENKDELTNIIDTFNSRLFTGRSIPSEASSALHVVGGGNSNSHSQPQPHPHYEGKEELTHFFDRLIGGRADHK